jgi:hypothetical protein
MKIKVFSSRNGSPPESHVLDNVLELLEEVLYKQLERRRTATSAT